MTIARYPSPDLTDGHVSLRRWSEGDLRCIEEASHDRAITGGTSVPSRFTPEEGLDFVKRQWSRVTDGVGVSQAIVETNHDVAVGLAFLGFRPQEGVAGIGFWLVGSARGRGHARRAVHLLTSWALDGLDLVRVEAWTHVNNVPSQRVLLGAGFEHEGRLRNFLRDEGKPCDALVFSRVPEPSDGTRDAPARGTN
jgi:[ribosomal protein S5]-alanine N-acetyltransferase